MSEVKKQAVRSVAVTLGAQAFKFFIGLGVTMVLARLLTPRDYGVVAMAAVFTGFVAVFKDGGLSIATVQRADISEAQLSTLFWINAAIGIAAALLVALLSPFVAWFYNDQSLVWIVVALAMPFILGGLSAQPQALLQRQMRFKEIAIIDIASLVISAGLGIAAAAAGWGSWALVAMSVTLALVNTLLVFLFCRWRPGRPVRGAGVRSLLRFGGQLTVNKIFDTLAGSLDSLLLGKYFSANTVGFYSRAQTVVLLPLTQIMPALLSVSLPVMSRLSQRPETLMRVSLDLLQLLSVVSSFITVFLFVGAERLVGILYGSQWAETADLLRLLSGMTLFLPISTLSVAIITAQGRGGILMRWGLVKNIVVIFAIFAGFSWGPQGVAFALSLSAIFFLLPILNSYTAKTGLMTLVQVWRAISIGIGGCFLGCFLFYFFQCLITFKNPLIALIVLFVADVLFHLLIIGIFPPSRRSFSRLITIFLSAWTK